MAASWTPLANQPPFVASTMLLLTDGTVMCRKGDRRLWWRLTPDQTGSYVSGIWSEMPRMRDARMYYGSAVLADGRVLVVGGEYAGDDDDSTHHTSGVEDLAAAEIYDPISDYWVSIFRSFELVEDRRRPSVRVV